MAGRRWQALFCTGSTLLFLYRRSLLETCRKLVLSGSDVGICLASPLSLLNVTGGVFFLLHFHPVLEKYSGSSRAWPLVWMGRFCCWDAGDSEPLTVNFWEGERMEGETPPPHKEVVIDGVAFPTRIILLPWA